MKKIIILLLAMLSITAFAQPTNPVPMNFGLITSRSGLTWDTVTNATGYRLYFGSTNLTGFVRASELLTNLWTGQALSLSSNTPPVTPVLIDGPYIVYVTAFNDNGESPPSDMALVTLLLGVPQPPKNFSFYRILTAASTNPLPPLTVVSPTP